MIWALTLYFGIFTVAQTSPVKNLKRVESYLLFKHLAARGFPQLETFTSEEKDIILFRKVLVRVLENQDILVNPSENLYFRWLTPAIKSATMWTFPFRAPNSKKEEIFHKILVRVFENQGGLSPQKNQDVLTNPSIERLYFRLLTQLIESATMWTFPFQAPSSKKEEIFHKILVWVLENQEGLSSQKNREGITNSSAERLFFRLLTQLIKSATMRVFPFRDPVSKKEEKCFEKKTSSLKRRAS